MSKELKFSSGNYHKKAYEGQTTTPSEGGETIPSLLADYFMDLLYDNTFVRRLASETIRMKGPSLKIPVKTSGLRIYNANEGLDITTQGGSDGASSSYSRSAWTSTTITVEKLAGISGFTTELEEDSFINIGNMVLNDLAIAFSEGEEQAWILGDSTGAIESYATGLPEYLFNGLIHQVPHSDNTTNGALWTPANTGYDHIQAGGSDLLTFNELNQLLANIGDVKGSGKVTDIIMTEQVLARMRNPVEFAEFQTIDKIGNKAALLTGSVGQYYGASITPSSFLPVGGQTDPATMTGKYVTGATDTVVIGFDRRSTYTIGQRRDFEIRTRHKFYNDLEEARGMERVAFKVLNDKHLGMIHNVKNSAT